MLASLDLPDYRRQEPEVVARFRHIRERRVVLAVLGLGKAFGHAGQRLGVVGVGLRRRFS